jgi:flavin reductase (DIM6/NTAB) family NADH-FMN oxidoreductase RutF
MTDRPYRATVVTEVSAALPFEGGVESRDSFATVMLRLEFRTAKAVRETQRFSLSIMPWEETEAVRQIYRGNKKSIQISYRGTLPYAANANASIFCLLDKVVDVGGHQLFIGRVTDATISNSRRRPLVNYNKCYCSVSDCVSVQDPEVKNSRLE